MHTAHAMLFCVVPVIQPVRGSTKYYNINELVQVRRNSIA